MNCTEFNIWLETTPERELISPNAVFQKHVESCSSCKRKLGNILPAIQFMNYQKNLALNSSRVSETIAIISQSIEPRSFGRRQPFIFVGRVAAAAIIIFGLLAGVLAGGLISLKSNNASSAWSTEFTMLSENTETLSYLFE